MKHIWLIAILFNTALCTWAQETSVTAKLSLPIVEARASIKNDLWNYGVAVTTQKLTPLFPVTFMAGNLSQGGSISRLNSCRRSRVLQSHRVILCRRDLRPKKLSVVLMLVRFITVTPLLTVPPSSFLLSKNLIFCFAQQAGFLIIRKRNLIRGFWLRIFIMRASIFVLIIRFV